MQQKLVNFVDQISFRFFDLHIGLLMIYLVYNFNMDQMNIVLILKLGQRQLNINKLFLIEMSKLKVFNFAHLRVLNIQFFYFFFLEWMDEDFGWCSFLSFLIAVYIEDTVIILSIQNQISFFIALLSLDFLPCAYFLISQSSKNGRQRTSVLVPSFYCNLSEIPRIIAY